MSWVMFLPFVFAVVYVTWFASAWPARARWFPLYVGMVGVVLGLLQLGVSYWRSTRRDPDAAGGRVLDAVFQTELPGTVVFRRSAALFGWLLGLLLGTLLIGFQLAVPVFLALNFWFHGKRNWWTNVPLIVGIWVLIFVALDAVLHVSWPDPLLLKWYRALFR